MLYYRTYCLVSLATIQDLCGRFQVRSLPPSDSAQLYWPGLVDERPIVDCHVVVSTAVMGLQLQLVEPATHAHSHYSSIQCTVTKEINCCGDSEIPHEIGWVMRVGL